MMGLDRGQPGKRYPGAQGRGRESVCTRAEREEGVSSCLSWGREAASVSLPAEWGSDLKGGLLIRLNKIYKASGHILKRSLRDIIPFLL